MSTLTLSTVCGYSCSSPNCRPRKAWVWPSSALMLSMAIVEADKTSENNFMPPDILQRLGARRGG